MKLHIVINFENKNCFMKYVWHLMTILTLSDIDYSMLNPFFIYTSFIVQKPKSFPQK